MNVGIFFGSDTGNTEKVARLLQKKLSTNIATIFDIANSSKNDLESYDRLILGISTWYYGEAQSDWEDFFPILKSIDFTDKIVALFGCGDQEDYTEYFCDAMGILRDIIEPRGAKLVGYWPTTNYFFASSKSLFDKNHFIGLAIDEERQPELTMERIDIWIQKIRIEMHLNK